MISMWRHHMISMRPHHMISMQRHPMLHGLPMILLLLLALGTLGHAWADGEVRTHSLPAGHSRQVKQRDYVKPNLANIRFQASGNLTIAAVGGSITSGQGRHDSYSWPEWLALWARQEYNGTGSAVSVVNSAVPGTLSHYMALCYNIHVPQDADIVVVEYALNDADTGSTVLYDNKVRRAFERLLRKLLNLPRQPAVIILNAFRWFLVDHSQKVDNMWSGMYYHGADREFQEFASYYRLPVLSVKACCYHLMLAGHPGFQVNRTRGTTQGKRDVPEVDAGLKHTAFFFDRIHPNGWTGHKVMAELVIHLLLLAERSIKKRPVHAADEQRLLDLPPPMILGNYESRSDRCYIGDTLRAVVVPHNLTDPSFPTFEWLNDRPAGQASKYGLTTTTPGAVLRLKVDTRIASVSKGVPVNLLASQASRLNATVANTSTLANTSMAANTSNQSVQAFPSPPGPKLALVGLGFLTSYEHMGAANVTCVSGCTCDSQVFRFLRQTKVSLTAVFELVVTQHEECVIEIRSMANDGNERRRSKVPNLGGQQESKVPGGQGAGGSKVKLSGLMLSDESVLEKGLFSSHRAMDWVMDSQPKLTRPMGGVPLVTTVPGGQIPHGVSLVRSNASLV